VAVLAVMGEPLSALIPVLSGFLREFVQKNSFDRAVLP